jgi:hypothetical protein
LEEIGKEEIFKSAAEKLPNAEKHKRICKLSI